MVTSNEAVSNDEMEQKITAQIEYYFGDMNLKQDKFMKAQIEENDGWFPIDKLMTFNRLKKLTTETEAVVNCIKNSSLVELSEDGAKMRRKTPIPEQSPEYVKELNLRTLHLKGFPKDSQLDDIMAFCTEFGKVQSIQMRRNFKNNNEFKGCIMVTFLSKEDADKVLANSDLKYKDTVLLKENKEKYWERKKNFYEALNAKRKGTNPPDESQLVKTKGAILKVVGFNKEVKFADIKEELGKHSKVAFVSNVNDKSECNVRFAVEDGAKETFKALKEQAEDKSEESEKVSIELCGQKVDISLASDEEEKAFWREFASKQQFRGPKQNKWQKGKKRFNRDNGGRQNKVAKMDKAGGDE